MDLPNYKFITLKEDPSLRSKSYEDYKNCWDEFMLHDEIAIGHKEDLANLATEFQLFVIDEQDNIIALCKSVPIFWNGETETLPNGYDEALTQAIGNLKNKKAVSNSLLGLSINIFGEYRGSGLSKICIDKLKSICKEQSFKNLIIPIRPTVKHKYPLAKIDDYIDWKNKQGKVFDPWIRTHIACGASILKVSHKSMTIKGSVSDWEQWTKMDFPQSGEYIINGALVPITIDKANDFGIYYEPNVWMQYNF